MCSSEWQLRGNKYLALRHLYIGWATDSNQSDDTTIELPPNKWDFDSINSLEPIRSFTSTSSSTPTVTDTAGEGPNKWGLVLRFVSA